MTTFRITGDDLVHSGYAFSLHDVEITPPEGEPFRRDVIRHRGAVGVVPLHADGTVTLVRQYRAPLDCDLLEIPAGLRDVEGEDTVVTAARELAEEAGLAADNYELLTVFHNAPGLSDERVWVYLATGLTHVGQDLQSGEEQYMTLERHPLEELVAMVERGEVTDSKTVIGALLASRR